MHLLILTASILFDAILLKIGQYSVLKMGLIYDLIIITIHTKTMRLFVTIIKYKTDMIPSTFCDVSFLFILYNMHILFSFSGTKKMEYKTRQWHEKCFSCVVCKSAIGTKSFIPREQEVYCATCYEEKFSTRCVKCDKVQCLQ